MSETKIQERKIIDFSFHVDPNLKTAQLKVDLKASFNKALEENAPSAQIVVHVNIHADSTDDFSLVATECFMVTFEKEPVDVKDALIKLFQDECLGIVYDDIDNAMIGLGKAPLNLKENSGTAPGADKDETPEN